MRAHTKQRIRQLPHDEIECELIVFGGRTSRQLELLEVHPQRQDILEFHLGEREQCAPGEQVDHAALLDSTGFLVSQFLECYIMWW